MSELPAVTIIVLNWNARDYLDDCLTALQNLDYPDFAVWLVDNASQDDSLALVETRFPTVRIIQNEANLGFSAGNNAGLRRVSSEFAVLLNPDVVVGRDWLRQLIAPLLADETIAVAGCKLRYPDNELLQHAGGYIDNPQGFPGHYGLRQRDEGQFDSLRDVDYVIGAALALRRRVLDEVGYWDEGFFLFYEDADFCYRARAAGYRVVYVPEATAVHIESVKTQKESDSYLQHMHTSRWRFLLKHTSGVDLLQKTVPAEQAWVARLPLRYRLAAAHAYRLALKQLPAILAARTAMNGQPLTENEVEQIMAALRDLHDMTWQIEGVYLNHVKRQAYVQERPFTSHIPVLGRFIAWLRQTWNNVSTRPYIWPLLQQQNEFNQLVTGRFEEQELRLQALSRRHARQVRETAAAAHQLQQMKNQLTNINRRLARLEAGQHSGDEGN